MIEDHVKFKLQNKANGVLAFEYDGSGDMWHYVTVFDHEYGINVWDADELGDGTETGLRITVYPCDDVTGEMKAEEWHNLKVEPLALKVCKLRLKLKGRKV